MSKMGDLNLQITEAMEDDPNLRGMTPQEALEAGLDIKTVIDTTLDKQVAQRASGELRAACKDWEDRVDVAAFMQWAEHKLTDDYDWGEFFTENNTEWETEVDGEPNLVFSGNWETLIENLIGEFEVEHGQMSDIAARVALKKLSRRLDDAFAMSSEWENQPDHLGEAINQAFDDYCDCSRDLIEEERERREEYTKEIERSINARKAN